MATLKEKAMAYEPQQTLNIADLEEIPVDLTVYDDGAGINAEGKEFTYSYAKLNGKEYRIANTIFEEIQKILKLKPSVTKVKVIKSGSGLATRYKVEALD